VIGMARVRRTPKRIVLTRERFERLNPREDEFFGSTKDQVWDALEEALRDDRIFQEIIDFVLNDTKRNS